MVNSRVMFEGQVCWIETVMNGIEMDEKGQIYEQEMYLLKPEEGARIDGKARFVWAAREQFVQLISSLDILETEWTMGVIRGLK